MTSRAEARVIWEESPRPSFDLYFETDRQGTEHLSAEPEAFLTACLIPAFRNGERRILVEGALCPRLAEGSVAAIALLGSWFGSPQRTIVVEGTEGFRVLTPRKPARAAFFLTGGIDSLHLLGTNRARYPRDHPASFADALSVHGNIGAESDDSPWNKRVLVVLERAAAEADLSLIPIRTNLWDLEPDLSLVAEMSLSSTLASGVHLFRSRWTDVTIASGRDAGRRGNEYRHR